MLVVLALLRHLLAYSPTGLAGKGEISVLPGTTSIVVHCTVLTTNAALRCYESAALWRALLRRGTLTPADRCRLGSGSGLAANLGVRMVSVPVRGCGRLDARAYGRMADSVERSGGILAWLESPSMTARGARLDDRPRRPAPS